MQDSCKWVTRVLLQLLFTKLLPKKTARIYYCNIFVSVTKEESNKVEHVYLLPIKFLIKNILVGVTK